MSGKQFEIFAPKLVDENTLSSLFNDWIDLIQNSKAKFEPATIEVYRDMWGQFSKYLLARDMPLKGITEGFLDEFLVAIGAKPGRIKYARRLLSLINRLLAYEAHRRGAPKNGAAADLLRHPDYKLPASDGDDKPPLTLQEQQQEALINWLKDNRPGPWKRQRDRAMFALMMGAGVKPGEVLVLELEAIVCEGLNDRSGHPFKVCLPGNATLKAREAPIATFAAVILEEWLETRATLGFKNSLVFPASEKSQKPLPKLTLYRQFEKVLDEIGIEKPKTGTHVLRHTFGVRQLLGGKTVKILQNWMGFSDQTGVQPYQLVVDGSIKAD